MKPSSWLIFITFSLLLAGCATPTSNASQERPMAFHDTRLQYALISDDSETLKRDFDMKLPPSWVERAAAVGVLPFTAATEAVFWPFSTAIKTWAPIPEYESSIQ